MAIRNQKVFYTDPITGGYGFTWGLGDSYVPSGGQINALPANQNPYRYATGDINTANILTKGGGMGMLPFGTAALGVLQLPFAIDALMKARKLKYSDYAMTPEMARSVSEGNQMRNVGFTGSEYNAYNQQLGQDRSTTFARARELGGGNLASTMMAILNGQNVNARNQLAVQDAALRRQNIAASNALNLQTQELANMNTAFKNDLVNKQKQAAANLMQSSLGNIASAANVIAGLSLGGK